MTTLDGLRSEKSGRENDELNSYSQAVPMNLNRTRRFIRTIGRKIRTRRPEKSSQERFGVIPPGTRTDDGKIPSNPAHARTIERDRPVLPPSRDGGRIPKVKGTRTSTDEIDKKEENRTFTIHFSLRMSLRTSQVRTLTGSHHHVLKSLISTKLSKII